MSLKLAKMSKNKIVFIVLFSLFLFLIHWKTALVLAVIISSPLYHLWVERKYFNG